MKTYSVVVFLSYELLEVVSVLRSLAVKLHPHGTVSRHYIELRLIDLCIFHFSRFICGRILLSSA